MGFYILHSIERSGILGLRNNGEAQGKERGTCIGNWDDTAMSWPEIPVLDMVQDISTRLQTRHGETPNSNSTKQEPQGRIWGIELRSTGHLGSG